MLGWSILWDIVSLFSIFHEFLISFYGNDIYKAIKTCTKLNYTVIMELSALHWVKILGELITIVTPQK